MEKQDELLAVMPVPKVFLRLAIPAAAFLLCDRFLSDLAVVYDGAECRFLDFCG